MGFQKSNDTSGMENNTRVNSSSHQKISNVSKLAKDTTKCQYERLSNTKTDKGTTGE